MQTVQFLRCPTLAAPKFTILNDKPPILHKWAPADITLGPKINSHLTDIQINHSRKENELVGTLLEGSKKNNVETLVCNVK